MPKGRKQQGDADGCGEGGLGILTVQRHGDGGCGCLAGEFEVEGVRRVLLDERGMEELLVC